MEHFPERDGRLRLGLARVGESLKVRMEHFPERDGRSMFADALRIFRNSCPNGALP